MRPVGDSCKTGDSGRNEQGQFKPGVSGNPKGRPPTSIVSLIAGQLKREAAKGEGTKADAIAALAIEKAEAGEEPYFSLALQRLWPVVKQVEVSTPPERPPVDVTNTEDERRKLASWAEAAEPPEKPPTHPPPETTQ